MTSKVSIRLGALMHISCLIVESRCTSKTGVGSMARIVLGIYILKCFDGLCRIAKGDFNGNLRKA